MIYLNMDIDPVIRKQLSRQYRDWESARHETKTHVMYICMRCRKRFNAKKTAFYRRPFWSRAREITLFEFICGKCLDKRQFNRVRREDFTRVIP